EQARNELNRGIGLHKQNPAMYQVLARVEIVDQKRPAAIDTLRRGAEAVGAGDRAIVLWDLAEILLETKEFAPAREVCEDLKKQGVASPQTDYLFARIDAAQGQWLEAAQALERLHDPLLAQWPLEAAKADLLLGSCYEQIGIPELAFAAYNRAVDKETDPLWVSAHLGKGSALAAMGKLDEAIDVYRRVNAKTGNDLAVQTTLIRALIKRNLDLPAAQRDWVSVEQAWASVERAFGDKWRDSGELALLRLETLVARGERK